MPAGSTAPLVTPTRAPLIALPRPPAPSFGAQFVTLIAIVLPLIGVLMAPFVVWGWGLGWIDLGLLYFMSVLTGFGITIGFHRLFVHRSFETYDWLKFVLVVLGSMTYQGSLFQWASLHRRHHQHSDTPDDPHTPHHQGTGLGGAVRGFWYAHLGWLFDAKPANLDHYIPDLRSSHTLRVANALYPLWVVLGLVIPAVIGGLWTQSWVGAGTGFIWGGLVRLFLVHHLTWSVNSACHLWGQRPYASDDFSRDNWFFGFLALGEGWHNTHHAFPTSARHGLRWWQVDFSYELIRTLAMFRLAWNLKLPSAEAQLKQRRAV